MESLRKSRVMMASSMAVFGTLSLFVRNIPLPSAVLAFCRAILAVILLGAYMVVTKQTVDFRAFRREIPLLMISGAAMGINWILLFEAYRYTTVSIATLSYYFAPIIVTLACPILFKEKMGRMQWICFVMSTVGIVLITGIGEPGGSDAHLTGIFFGLGAAVFYAAVILLNKFIKGVAGIQRTFVQFLAAAVVLLPYVLCSGGLSLEAMNEAGWINLLIVGIIHTGLNYCLYFSSLKSLPGQEAAILSYIDPLVAVLVSVFWLGETMQGVQILGGTLILGFTLYNEIKTEN